MSGVVIIGITILVKLLPVQGGGTLVETDFGHAITGRGCGTLKPIRYLKEIPQDLSNHECSIIYKEGYEDGVVFLPQGKNLFIT